MTSHARFVCVGTHHKTGTVWMRRVWHAISRDQDIPLMPIYRPKRLAELPETGPQIVVNWSSAFPAKLHQMAEARFLHVIRDPRDVLLSGARYHEVAPLGREKFLANTRDEWGGRNYREQLQHLPDRKSKLLFEMENKHDETVQEMLRWRYGAENCIELRYEDLIEDVTCKLFRGALEQLAIEGLDIERAVKCYWDESLFGGKANAEKMPYIQNLHVHSGAKAQWEAKLPRDVAEIYADRYGDALKTLGYAQNDTWVERCSSEAA